MHVEEEGVAFGCETERLGRVRGLAHHLDLRMGAEQVTQLRHEIGRVRAVALGQTGGADIQADVSRIST